MQKVTYCLAYVQKSNVLSGISHVLSGTSAKSHVLSGISAKSHVLSGISHILITMKYSCGRRGGFELKTDGFRIVFNDFLPAGKIKKSKGPPDSSQPASMSTKSHVLSGISTKSHILTGISTKSHVLSGIDAKCHVLSGTSVKNNVLSGINAKGHVLSGIRAKK